VVDRYASVSAIAYSSLSCHTRVAAERMVSITARSGVWRLHSVNSSHSAANPAR
jgi:flavodoxin